MNEYLYAKLKTLPLEPGCYLMKDKNGTIIYVGKAKVLKNRVNSYFMGAHNYKTTKLVSNIADFDYIVTGSEKEALLLEINLIKKHRPKYNIMFMDDKSYPYIKLSNEAYPTLKVVRDLKKDRKAKYFGPFPDATAAHNTMKLLNTLYPLRKCRSMPKKVCLYYHIGSCLGPCEKEIDPEIYAKMKNDITKFLKGDVKDIKKELQEKMDQAIEHMAFEQAKEIHDLMISIDHIIDKQQIQTENNRDLDVFNYYADKGYLAIQGFFVRHGTLLEKELSLTPLYDDPQESFISFILQYYQSHPMADELIVPLEVDISSLNELLDQKISQPFKGYRLKLLDMAKNNAKNNLVQKFDVLDRVQDNNDESLSELAALLHKDSVSRIEIYDNSHLSGHFTVAGVVVYIDGVPSKNDYRLYKLHTQNSDVDSMKEVFYRRYFRMLNENGPFPDLILVDGGLNQIHAAKEILEQLDIHLTVCGLVKNEKHQTSNLMDEEGNIIPVSLESPLFFMLTRMQDEVHRFAISYHRRLRSKAQTKSILDDIEGVGEVRKKKLLNHFKSFKRIQAATLEELSEIVPKEVASNIYDVLHS